MIHKHMLQHSIPSQHLSYNFVILQIELIGSQDVSATLLNSQRSF